MPRLNSLLTASEVIAHFENDVIHSPEWGMVRAAQAPSPLQKFKNRLKAIYLPFLGKPKKVSFEEFNQNMLESLGFWPVQNWKISRLHHVLVTIIATPEGADLQECLKRLHDAPEMLFDHYGEGDDWDSIFFDSPFLAAGKIEELNQHFGHWIDPSSPETIALFMKLASACHKICIFYEYNSDYASCLAFSYAYKIMILFYDHPDNRAATADANSDPIDVHAVFMRISTQVDNFLKDKGLSFEYPFYSIFEERFHLPAFDSIHDHKGWLNFIKANGHKSLRYFQYAAAIEEQINILSFNQGYAAPESLQSAQFIYATSIYYSQDGELDKSFAELCFNHNIEPADFNKCIEYLLTANKVVSWPKKKADNVPNLFINGQRAASDFFWTKLPFADKRTLILGHLSHCCQVLGSISESVVIDGCERQNNAFYALFKKKRGMPVVPLQDYSDYEILGQSYVWMTEFGDFCIDSIEYIPTKVSIEAWEDITSDFAQGLLEHSPSIRFVLLGKGGHTPRIFRSMKFTQKMKEGWQCYDSKEQYCLAQRHDLVLPTPYNETEYECQEYVRYISALVDDRQLFDVLNELILKPEFVEYQISIAKKIKFVLESMRTQGRQINEHDLPSDIAQIPLIANNSFKILLSINSVKDLEVLISRLEGHNLITIKEVLRTLFLHQTYLFIDVVPLIIENNKYRHADIDDIICADHLHEHITLINFYKNLGSNIPSSDFRYFLRRYPRTNKKIVKYAPELVNRFFYDNQNNSTAAEYACFLLHQNTHALSSIIESLSIDQLHELIEKIQDPSFLIVDAIVQFIPFLMKCNFKNFLDLLLGHKLSAKFDSYFLRCDLESLQAMFLDETISDYTRTLAAMSAPDLSAFLNESHIGFNLMMLQVHAGRIVFDMYACLRGEPELFSTYLRFCFKERQLLTHFFESITDVSLLQILLFCLEHSPQIKAQDKQQILLSIEMLHRLKRKISHNCVEFSRAYDSHSRRHGLSQVDLILDMTISDLLQIGQRFPCFQSFLQSSFGHLLPQPRIQNSSPNKENHAVLFSKNERSPSNKTASIRQSLHSRLFGK